MVAASETDRSPVAASSFAVSVQAFERGHPFDLDVLNGLGERRLDDIRVHVDAPGLARGRLRERRDLGRAGEKEQRAEHEQGSRERCLRRTRMAAA